MTSSAKSPYTGYRFPPEIISHAVWLYFRFPLSLRMVDEVLAARGIMVSHETVRQWALKFGQAFANQIRRGLSRAGDRWHLDEVVVKSPSRREMDGATSRCRIPEGIASGVMQTTRGVNGPRTSASLKRGKRLWDA